MLLINIRGSRAEKSGAVMNKDVMNIYSSSSMCGISRATKAAKRAFIFGTVLAGPPTTARQMDAGLFDETKACA